MKFFKIHVNDMVLVRTGKDAGSVGKVLKVFHKKDSIIVEKVNIGKRHVKPNPYAEKPGEIVEREMPLNVTNVMLMCPSCGEPTRILFRKMEKNGKLKKLRFCRKCNEEITTKH